jgi:glutamate/tyrosine decarboxylase-like PLP-dependent enzyme
MVSGGSLANLEALALARNLRYDVAKTGLFGLRARPVILASREARTSLRKAAMVLGFGSEAIITLSADANWPNAAMVAQAISDQRAAGNDPFCVVATAGTTVLGAIDDIAGIAAVTQPAGIWLHVDAAYAGALIFSPTYRQLLNGIHLADSITFNPQNGVYVAKTCATLLVRDRRLAPTRLSRVGALHG